MATLYGMICTCAFLVTCYLLLDGQSKQVSKEKFVSARGQARRLALAWAVAGSESVAGTPLTPDTSPSANTRECDTTRSVSSVSAAPCRQKHDQKGFSTEYYSSSCAITVLQRKGAEVRRDPQRFIRG